MLSSSPLLAQALSAAPLADGESAVNLHHMANWFAYTPMQYQSVLHVFTLGYGVFAAALVFFILTLRKSHDRFQLSSVISCVVTISAGLILYHQSSVWENAFVFNEATGMYERIEGRLFSNGFRYMNWMIDVPNLLLSMLVLLPLAGAARSNITKWGAQFVVAGLVMVFCSWLGSFWEQGQHVAGRGTFWFWVNYLIGWVAYVWILVVVWQVINAGLEVLPERSAKLLRTIRTIFLISWTVYAFTLVQPLFWWSPVSVVTRQFLFTLADITSKAIYGVLLATIGFQLTDEFAARGENQSKLTASGEPAHAEA
ncbi:bacteriorhodopsin [Phycisphaera mikurensis]|uniref:Hypothetical membrane protein n=1 Tax=Phycisphaera mikurensis (strain NBRC 102666 / KCTC 22515 / FYK2301M01) TaxID=1142394 RepID=I0IBH0_PHYMF|nr:bacteriorhodopsin [Phycisphaera mikurensis]MBB6442860.1 bacteriorhodopsin [Phycisphaera mikurensis]BAM02608.1 hypothetical membrane protein [Phycisphaera mikurensis NBRC 102666]